MITFGFTSACSSMTPDQIRELKSEIARIGSGAQTPGARDAGEIQRINDQVIVVWSQIDTLSGVDSSKTTPDLKKKKAGGIK